MKNCTITSQEVKTIYEIRISEYNMMQIIVEASKLDKEFIEANGAFQYFQLNDNPAKKETCDFMERLWNKNAAGNSSTLRVIVNTILDFDGIEDTGMYYNHYAHMKVYKYGDHINQ